MTYPIPTYRTRDRDDYRIRRRPYNGPTWDLSKCRGTGAPPPVPTPASDCALLAAERMKGYNAAACGEPATANPHEDPEAPASLAWAAGWLSVQHRQARLTGIYEASAEVVQ